MVAVIIPVFNRIEFTINCIKSLEQTSKIDFKIFLIDDGSSDGTSERVKSEFNNVEIIQGDGNWWWTKSVNIGMKEAIKCKFEYIVLLNNDTLATNGFLTNLINPIIEDHHIVTGALGIDQKTRRPVQVGQTINWKIAKVLEYPKGLDITEYSGLKKVTHLPGRGLAFHRSLIDAGGYLNEKTFPQYLADFDFTHRARRNGFQLFCNYDAKLIIYPDESGDLQNRKNKNLTNYMGHLFGIKGGGNLALFLKFALINCPSKYLPLYLPIGILRRIFGYWLK